MSDEVSGAEHIAATLDAAIEEDSPTSETGKDNLETADSPESKKGKVQTIPYSRFKEVNDAKNSLQEKYSTLEKDFNEKVSSITKLTQMLEETKDNADLLKEIRALRHDPEALPHLEAIDRKLRGIEEEAEETGEVDEKKVSDIQDQLKRHKSELSEQLEEQQMELLIQRGDTIADKWLTALPEEYTEQDKEIISRLWADEVDWNKIKSDPNSLSDHLKETFQSVIDVFGTPRGGLVSPEDTNKETEEEPSISEEEKLMQEIKGKNYGALKEVDKGGKKVLLPEISDDDFASDLAAVLRANRR